MELMYLFHLRVSRIIKEATMERLRCSAKKSDNYKNVQRTFGTFASLRMPTIKQIYSLVIRKLHQNFTEAQEMLHSDDCEILCCFWHNL